MELQAKDLRIGNLISFTYMGTISEVAFIKRGCVYVKAYKRAFRYLVLEPIPLTDDILFKTGFEKHSNHFFYRKFEISLMLEEGVTYHFCNLQQGWSAFHVKIQYVHELQNIYFSIMGKELEIKL